MTKIIIEIKGGNIQNIIANNPNIEIVVLDYDNDEIGDGLSDAKYQPDAILTDEGIQEYIEREVEISKNNNW